MPNPVSFAARPTVVVVGGGVTGLSAAWTLLAASDPPHVVLLEKSGALGGKIRGTHLGEHGVEAGPDGFVGADSALTDIAGALGLGDALVSARSASVRIWSRGALRELPAGLVMGLPVRALPVLRSRLLTLRELLRAGADLVLPRSRLEDDVSIGRLVGDRMGRGVVERLVEPLLGGVYAGRADVLGADAVLPGLRSRLRARRSLIATLRGGGIAGAPRGLVTLRGGLSRLVDALAEGLRARGCELRTSTAVDGIVPRGNGWTLRLDDGSSLDADGVIITVPAAGAARMLTDVTPEAGVLAEVSYASLAVAMLLYPPHAVPPTLLAGNGILVPRVEGRLVRACTWVTSKWDHVNAGEHVIVRCSTGADGDQRFAALDDRSLLAALHRELAEMTGIITPPLTGVVTRWPDALPQYRAGHRDMVNTVRAALPHTIRVAGAAYDGVGLTACANHGRDAALALVASPISSIRTEVAHV